MRDKPLFPKFCILAMLFCANAQTMMDTPVEQTPKKPKIRIAAALVTDAQGRLLLVRKRGTGVLIQPGGKIEPGESPENTIKRELKEELDCTPTRIKFCGQFSAPAANEPGHIVEALLYEVDIQGEIVPTAEIEEVTWIDPKKSDGLVIAPLTRNHIMPLAGARPR
jgi:8-oxo-dGTP diphosphatase